MKTPSSGENQGLAINLLKIIERFKEKNILVIGDIMLDKYIYGDVSRISPEAPVPVVKVKKESFALGGAANTALNIVELGGGVFLIGFIGKDKKAVILKKLLKKRKIPCFLESTLTTTQKTRIFGKEQQLLRFDEEETTEKIFTDKIKKKILRKAKEADIIIISDYAKGVITKDLMSLLMGYKRKMIVDPKPKNKILYRNAFLITPNEKESLEMASCSNIEEAGIRLKEELNSNVLITRGERGMLLFSDNKIVELPTYAREVYDVIGAGDTAIAALALSIASGSSLNESAVIANTAAGIAVEKKGTYPVSLKELKSKVLSEESKIVDFDDLKKIVEDYKKKNRKIIWTNGCFDLLHIGHIEYLQKAKNLGDILIVGLNSDSSVKALKGPGRPIQSQTERAEILSSLKFVDYILIFSETTVERYLKELKPDIFAKGSDYSLKAMSQKERKAMASCNGKIVFIPIVKGKSTSKMIEKIKNG